MRYTAIDLFSGAGGLTVGLKRAGFNVVAAVEIDKASVDTYRANHPRTKVLDRDIREISGAEILKVSGERRIDLVAGCPPCQGFSSLTGGDDPRNFLVLEMARIVEELKPNICMLENVPGLDRRGRTLLSGFESKLSRMGYIITKGVLQMADFGVPQSRKRLVLLAGRGFKIDLPKPTHSREGANGLKRWNALRVALAGIGKPVPLSRAVKKGGVNKFNWHVVRDLSPINQKRLKYLKAGKSRSSLPLELRPPCHRNTNSGFQNVYARMHWNNVAPTMTSGCTTLSAGRFGHPTANRTISVREAALIQTFPKNYRFETEHISKACELVGNALPCRFAEIVSRECIEALIK